jgi:hypothetical protein
LGQYAALPPSAVLQQFGKAGRLAQRFAQGKDDRPVGATRVVNAGSVGMPFGEAGAYWLFLEPDIVFRHTPYDLARAAARIRSTAYPQAKAFAQRNVLQPPSETEMLALYANVELQE